MNAKAQISCKCGHRVVSRNVLTTGYLLHTRTGVYVFVKFRCPRCKKLGQEVISRDRWDWSVLDEAAGEIPIEEKRRFDEMGPIEMDEAIRFHYDMEASEKIGLETEAPD